MKISGGRKIKNNQIVGGSTEEQVIAANIDVTFIVVGLDQNFNLQRIERYITMVYNSASKPVILLNKVDKCDEVDYYINQVKNIAFGIDIHAISAANEINIDKVRQYLKPGKTVVFLGSSGVGKSTLTNVLFHISVNDTKEVSDKTGKGRHTTTSAELFVHEDGYMIIDTPGLRELQLWGDERLLEDSFHDVVELISQCKFRDCHHDKEPGCAIKKAIKEGTLSEERYHSYLKQLGEFRTLSKRHKEVQRYLNKVNKYNRWGNE